MLSGNLRRYFSTLLLEIMTCQGLAVCPLQTAALDEMPSFPCRGCGARINSKLKVFKVQLLTGNQHQGICASSQLDALRQVTACIIEQMSAIRCNNVKCTIVRHFDEVSDAIILLFFIHSYRTG